MKRFLFIAAFFVCKSSWSQTIISRDSINYYLNKIDNYSVTITHKDVFTVDLNSDGQIVSGNADKYVTDRLIGFLADSNKVLVCHVLLTKLLEPGNKSLYYTSEDFTEKIVFYYRYNGLAWKKVFDKTNLSAEINIDSSAMQMVKAYWMLKKGGTLNNDSSAGVHK